MSSMRQDLGRQLLTAIRWQRDDAEAARLVAAGADMMFDSGDGAGAPLRWAARNGLADSVVCLLRHRADPDAPDACVQAKRRAASRTAPTRSATRGGARTAISAPRSSR